MIPANSFMSQPLNLCIKTFIYWVNYTSGPGGAAVGYMPITLHPGVRPVVGFTLTTGLPEGKMALLQLPLHIIPV